MTQDRQNVSFAQRINGTMTEANLTRDSWYDGSLTLWQPRNGFRATTDAVLLAAAVDSDAVHALELGAGGGAATLALARRCGEMRITAIEGDPLMAELLQRNIETNALNDRIFPLHANIFDEETALSWREAHDHVYFNPPYNDAASTLSGDERRKAAMAVEDLKGWIKVAIRALVSRGQITLISRADRLPEILEALETEKTGSIVLRMVHTEAHLPAIRTLVRARKGIAGRLEILPPLVMREGTDTITGKMEAISHYRDEVSMNVQGRQYRKPRLAPRLD